MKILVAIDGSDCSTKALDFIAKRPWKNEDEFLVLSVAEPIPAEVGLGYVPEPSLCLDDQIFHDCAQLSGKGGAKLAEALPLNPVQARVESGPVADTIVKMADDWHADLIILGSHGRKGLKHFFLGSIAEQVLKKSHCSIEVVKSKAA